MRSPGSPSATWPPLGIARGSLRRKRAGTPAMIAKPVARCGRHAGHVTSAAAAGRPRPCPEATGKSPARRYRSARDRAPPALAVGTPRRPSAGPRRYGGEPERTVLRARRDPAASRPSTAAPAAPRHRRASGLSGQLLKEQPAVRLPPGRTGLSPRRGTEEPPRSHPYLRRCHLEPSTSTVTGREGRAPALDQDPIALQSDPGLSL